MKICILSDFHCKHDVNLTDSSETLLYSNMPRIPKEQHPVAAMIDLIRKQKIDLKCDGLFFLGDLCDQSDEQGVVSGWQFVEEIKREIDATTLLGLPGNHDVNSRKNLNKESFDFITSFHENFPTDDAGCNDKFWNLGYCFYEFEGVITLMVNSVLYHTDKDKAKVSEIKPKTLSQIKEDLKTYKKSTKVKICVLHHHPCKHSNIQHWKDGDSLEKGDKLIQLLSQNNFSIIMHGHKHQPRIKEEEGLPILAAGSFSCFANLLGTSYKTMFHILEINPDNSKQGQIHSWEFNIESGWEQTNNKHFPSRIGFGTKVDLKLLAANIHTLYKKKNEPLIFSQIKEVHPELDYILPNDLIKLNENLTNNYNLTTSPKWPLDPVIITSY